MSSSSAACALTGRRAPNGEVTVLGAVVLAFACATTARVEGAKAGTRQAPQPGAGAELRARPDDMPEGTQGRPSAEERAAGLAWRFHSGAPLPGAPAIARDGRVYAASSDGYVHALEADGAFRWSYTVTGRVVGGPGVDSSGRLYLATAAQRVYALTGAGSRWWLFRAPVSPATGVAVAPEGVVYFAGSDRHLWALSPRAIVLWRAPFKGSIAGDPVAGRMSVAIGTSTGTVSVIHGASRRWDLELGDAIATKPVVFGAFLYVIAGTKLVALRSGNAVPLWTYANSAFVAAADAERVVVAGRDGTVRFVASADGKELFEIDVGGASAPPAIRGDVAFVPCDDGVLRIVDAARGTVDALRVARAPLLEPSMVGNTVVVAAGDGTIAGIDATHWGRREP